MTPENRRSSLLGNSGWNLAAFVFTLIANLATVPFVLRWIGLQEFGRAGIVIAVAAPFTLAGTVLGQAAIREVSARIGRKEHNAAAYVSREALKVCLATSVVSWVALLIVGPWITSGISGHDAPTNLNSTLPFLIVACGIFAQQFSLVLQGISVGCQNFRNVAKASAWSSFSTVVATLGCSWLVPTVNGYLIGFTASLILTSAGWFVVTAETLRVKGPRRASNSGERASLLHFGKWQGIAQLAGIFGNQMDRYVLASLAPAAFVGQYNICNRIQEAAYVAVIRVCEVIFPRFGSLANSEEDARLSFFLAASWVGATFGAIVLSPVAILAKPLLTLWVGGETAVAATRLLQILVVGGVVGCASNVFFYYALGMAKNALATTMSLAYSTMTVAFSIVLIWQFGPHAAGTGLLAASIVRIPLILLMARKRFFSVFTFEQMFASTIAPTLVGSLCALAFYSTDFIWIQNWLVLGFAYCLFSFAVAGATVFVGLLSKTGRIILSGIWISFINALLARRFASRKNPFNQDKRGH